MYEEPRPASIVRRRHQLRVLANEALEVLLTTEDDGGGEADSGAGVDEQTCHLTFAVERCLIQRREPDGVLDVGVGSKFDQRGEGCRLCLDDREVQSRAAMIGPVHPLIEIGAGRASSRIAAESPMAAAENREWRAPWASR